MGPRKRDLSAANGERAVDQTLERSEAVLGG